MKKKRVVNNNTEIALRVKRENTDIIVRQHTEKEKAMIDKFLKDRKQ